MKSHELVLKSSRFFALILPVRLVGLPVLELLKNISHNIPRFIVTKSLCIHFSIKEKFGVLFKLLKIEFLITLITTIFERI